MRRKKNYPRPKWLEYPSDELEESLLMFAAMQEGIEPIDLKSERPNNTGLSREARRKFRKLWRQGYFTMIKKFFWKAPLPAYHVPEQEPGFTRRRARERMVTNVLMDKIVNVLLDKKGVES